LKNTNYYPQNYPLVSIQTAVSPVRQALPYNLGAILSATRPDQL